MSSENTTVQIYDLDSNQLQQLIDFCQYPTAVKARTETELRRIFDLFGNFTNKLLERNFTLIQIAALKENTEEHARFLIILTRTVVACRQEAAVLLKTANQTRTDRKKLASAELNEESIQAINEFAARFIKAAQLLSESKTTLPKDQADSILSPKAIKILIALGSGISTAALLLDCLTFATNFTPLHLLFSSGIWTSLGVIGFLTVCVVLAIFLTFHVYNKTTQTEQKHTLKIELLNGQLKLLQSANNARFANLDKRLNNLNPVNEYDKDEFTQQLYQLHPQGKVAQQPILDSKKDDFITHVSNHSGSAGKAFAIWYGLTFKNMFTIGSLIGVTALATSSVVGYALPMLISGVFIFTLVFAFGIYTARKHSARKKLQESLTTTFNKELEKARQYQELEREIKKVEKAANSNSISTRRQEAFPAILSAVDAALHLPSRPASPPQLGALPTNSATAHEVLTRSSLPDKPYQRIPVVPANLLHTPPAIEQNAVVDGMHPNTPATL
jgi:Flp pilus assembly protein TadB